MLFENWALSKISFATITLLGIMQIHVQLKNMWTITLNAMFLADSVNKDGSADNYDFELNTIKGIKLAHLNVIKKPCQ